MSACIRKVCLAILLALNLRRRVKREKYTHLKLLREISEAHAESDYKNYYRMNEHLFNELLKKITPI